MRMIEEKKHKSPLHKTKRRPSSMVHEVASGDAVKFQRAEGKTVGSSGAAEVEPENRTIEIAGKVLIIKKKNGRKVGSVLSLQFDDSKARDNQS